MSNGSADAFNRFRKTFQAGDVIFSEYEPGDNFYLIQVGRLQIVKIFGELEKKKGWGHSSWEQAVEEATIPGEIICAATTEDERTIEPNGERRGRRHVGQGNGEAVGREEVHVQLVSELGKRRASLGEPRRRAHRHDCRHER